MGTCECAAIHGTPQQICAWRAAPQAFDGQGLLARDAARGGVQPKPGVGPSMIPVAVARRPLPKRALLITLPGALSLLRPLCGCRWAMSPALRFT